MLVMLGSQPVLSIFSGQFNMLTGVEKSSERNVSWYFGANGTEANADSSELRIPIMSIPTKSRALRGLAKKKVKAVKQTHDQKNAGGPSGPRPKNKGAEALNASTPLASMPVGLAPVADPVVVMPDADPVTMMRRGLDGGSAQEGQHDGSGDQLVHGAVL